MKLKTKKITFIISTALTALAVGAGLGLVFGIVNSTDTTAIAIDQKHAANIASACVFSFSAITMLLAIEFGLSFFISNHFIKNRKEKLKANVNTGGVISDHVEETPIKEEEIIDINLEVSPPEINK